MRSRAGGLVAVLLVAAACSESRTPLPTELHARNNVVSGELPRYVVVFKGQGLPRDVERIIADAGGTISASIPEIGAIQVTSGAPDFETRIGLSSTVQAVSPAVILHMIPEPEASPAVDASESPGPTEPAGPDPQPGTDPLYNQQWDKMRMNASLTGSYAVQRGRREVVVSILDTGADPTHPDIAPNLDVVRSHSFVPYEQDIDDHHGHGSWCASAVGAPINGVGISGVAPGVTLVALKVLDRTGGGDLFWLAQALVYAGVNKFDVASMSLSGVLRHADHYQAYTYVLQRAVNFARANGVTLLAALGNDNWNLSDGNFFKDYFVYPAELDGVIGVSATGYTNRKAYYSNYGVGKTDIAAPGGGSTTFEPFPPGTPPYYGFGRVLGAWTSDPSARGNAGPYFTEQCTPGPGGPCYLYAWIRGTSMATPNAAGVAALIVSQYGDFTPDNSQKAHMSPQQVESILQRTANNQACVSNTEQIYVTTELVAECQGTAGGYTSFFGKGIVDALKAVTQGPGSGAADVPVSSAASTGQ